MNYLVLVGTRSLSVRASRDFVSRLMIDSAGHGYEPVDGMEISKPMISMCSYTEEANFAVSVQSVLSGLSPGLILEIASR